MDLDLPVHITDTAIREIKNIRFEKQISDEYQLRLGLKGAGCSASYLIGFDHITATDLTFEYENINIIIDKKHLMYLAGVELDFEAGEHGKGFCFNPKQ